VEGYDLEDVIRFEDEISLTIPNDKKFIDKPENLSISFEGYEFNGAYIQQGDQKMVLKKVLLIKNGIIRKSDFANWTKFIESIKEFNKYLLSITNK
jgi:hypothetical protein